MKRDEGRKRKWKRDEVGIIGKKKAGENKERERGVNKGWNLKKKKKKLIRGREKKKNELKKEDTGEEEEKNFNKTTSATQFVIIIIITIQGSLFVNFFSRAKAQGEYII